MNNKPIEYLNGWRSHMSGISRSENPYKIEAQYHSYDMWDRGWFARENSEKSSLCDYRDGDQEYHDSVDMLISTVTEE